MTLRDLRLRLRAIFIRRSVERDLDDELAFHIDREAAKLVAAGLDPAEARRRARVRFGSVALAADQCRDERRIALVDTTIRDVVYGAREFRRAPLTALTIVATVALGLGIVAVVFMFYSAMFLRTDEVPNPDRLVEVRRPPEPGAPAWVPFTRPDYEALRRETAVFTDAVAVLKGVVTRVEGRSLSGTLVTGNFFQTLGVRATLGRTFGPSDDERGGSQPVIVLSHQGWTKFYQGDPDVVGRPILLNGHAHRVVGVMSPGFRGLALAPPDFRAPLGQLQAVRADAARNRGGSCRTTAGRCEPAQ